MRQFPFSYTQVAGMLLALSANAIAPAQQETMPSQYSPGPDGRTPPPLLNAQPPGEWTPPGGNAPYPMRTGQAASTALARGRELLRQGQPIEAVNMFRNYARLRPNDAYGHFWLGLALDESGQPSQAIWAYSKSLDLAMRDGMDSAELRVNIANTLMKLGRLDDALFNYRRAIEIDSTLARAHSNLARALLQKGDAQGAFESLNRCTELGLNDPTLFYYQGQALESLGKFADARGKLDLFQRTLPESVAGQPLRMRVEEMLRRMPAAAETGKPDSGVR